MTRRTTPLTLFLAMALLAWIAVFITSISLGAATKAKLISEWPKTPVIVDGKDTEWPALVSIAKDVHLSIAVKNDDRTLYIALITSDAVTALQMLNEGLIVWLDVEGGTKKRFGLHYPVGRPAGAPGGSRGRYPSGSGQRGDQEQADEQQGQGNQQSGRYVGPPPDADAVWNRAVSDGRLAVAELLGPEKDEVRTLMLDASPSILAKIGRAEGMMVYELAIPLAVSPDSPEGLGTRPGAIVGIGLETPERKADAGSSGGRGAGGMGGGGGGMGGGMGGRGGGGYGGGGGRGGGGYGGGGTGGRGGGMGGPGGSFGQQAKPLNAWTTVQLATPPVSK